MGRDYVNTTAGARLASLGKMHTATRLCVRLTPAKRAALAAAVYLLGTSQRTRLAVPGQTA